MAVAAGDQVTDVCVYAEGRGNRPRSRRENGVKMGHLVKCNAPVTINIAVPTDTVETPQTAEHGTGAVARKRPVKGRCSESAVKTAAVAVVVVLLLGAVTVLLLHFLSPGEDGYLAATKYPGPDDGAVPREVADVSPQPDEASNGTAALANVTADQGDAATPEETHSCVTLEEMLQLQCVRSENDSSSENCPRYYSRTEWKAKFPNKRVEMLQPIKYVVVSHTALSRCDSLKVCSETICSMQNNHMSHGYDDLAYNFLVADDGSVYEGRGWTRASSHLKSRGNTALGVSFPGDYRRYHLTQQQVNSTALLLEHGMRCGYLHENYELLAHNQTRTTESPGQFVFDEIKNWPHYSDTVLY